MAKENSLLGAVKGSKAVPPQLAGALAKLPGLSVPRPHGAAAGILPLWDLFQDDASGLGIMVLKDGTYRCCFEIDGVHVSGFDEVRMHSLMNHFTGFINGIDTSVQMTIACHNISKREYFEKHPVECAEDDFLRYVGRVVENDQASLLSRNFIPELHFYMTFVYRPPKEKAQKQSMVQSAVNSVMDAFTSSAARQSVGAHLKNVTTLVQRANGYISQLGACSMTGRPISAMEYFRMLYRELNPRHAALPEDTLPLPLRPNVQAMPPSVRRIFPDMEPATIRQQLVDSRYDFGAP